MYTRFPFFFFFFQSSETLASKVSWIVIHTHFYYRHYTTTTTTRTNVSRDSWWKIKTILFFFFFGKKKKKKGNWILPNSYQVLSHEFLVLRVNPRTTSLSVLKTALHLADMALMGCSAEVRTHAPFIIIQSSSSEGWFPPLLIRMVLRDGIFHFISDRFLLDTCPESKLVSGLVWYFSCEIHPL